MTRIAGAQLKIYYVNVQFRDRGSRKKNGGELCVVEFGNDAVYAEAFANLLRRSKYREISFIWNMSSA